MQLYFLKNKPVIGVVIPAWNEEKYLGLTLEALLNQTMKPSFIVVVDDGSTDRTYKLSLAYGVYAVRRKKKSYSLVGNPHEAETWNIGIKTLQKILNTDYLMILGADHVLSKNYIEILIKNMIETSGLVITSGTIDNEYSRIPRGSGRIYNYKFFESLGFFPENFGGESYPIHKALDLGYKIKVIQEAKSFSQRKTGRSKIKMIALGKGRKALGYGWLFMLGSFVLNIKHFRSQIYLMTGYLSRDIKKYPELKFARYKRNSIAYLKNRFIK